MPTIIRWGEDGFLRDAGEGSGRINYALSFIAAFDQREKQLELREKLVEVEELRRGGVVDSSARSASQELRKRMTEGADV